MILEPIARTSLSSVQVPTWLLSCAFGVFSFGLWCGLRARRGPGRRARSRRLVCSTKPDEFPVSGEGVASVCLNAISPFAELASDTPMGIPDFSSWVLYDDSIAEIEFRARELRPAFFDLFSVLKPLFHVSG